MNFKTQYFNLWSVAWGFHKKWADNTGALEEWERIVAEAEKICENNESSSFIKGLIGAVIAELERVDRAKGGGADEKE